MNSRTNGEVGPKQGPTFVVLLDRLRQESGRDVRPERGQAAEQGSRACGRMELPVPVDRARQDAGLAADVCVQPDARLPLCSGVSGSSPICSCSMPGWVFWVGQWAETTIRPALIAASEPCRPSKMWPERVTRKLLPVSIHGFVGSVVEGDMCEC